MLKSVLKLCGLFLGLCTLAAYFALPYLYQVKKQGTLYLKNSKVSITISREKESMIPHIRGPDKPNVFYGQGFMHAQTRLWQLEKMRRIAAGQLSELFGQQVVSIDKLMLLMRVYSSAVDTVPSLSPEITEYLQRYADGINDYMSGVALGSSEGTAKVLPPEFYIFGIEWRPWTVADSVAALRVMNIQMSFSWPADILREILRHSPDFGDLAEEILPYRSDFMSGNDLPIVDDEQLKIQGQYSDKSLLDRHKEAAEHLKKAHPPLSRGQKANQGQQETKHNQKEEDFSMGGGASNSWVISGNHTKSGIPLMANDFHMVSTVPSVLTFGELSWGDNFLFGAQLPGFPGVINGRNNNFAWSLTNSVSDTTDLWQEELNEDGTKYKVDGEWRDLKQVPLQIKVRGKEPVEFNMKLTHRGTLVDYDSLKFDKVFPNQTLLEGKQYSIAWPLMNPGDDAFSFLFGVSSAQSVEEAFKMFDTVGKEGFNGNSLNVLMADTQGNIGYQLLAAIPVRKDRTPFIGLRVLDGTSSAYDWEGNGTKTVPLTQLPRSFNPSSGFIATANNRQTSDNAKEDYGSGLFSTPRARRISDLIEQGIKAGKKFTVADMKEMQVDTVDIYAKQEAPELVRAALIVKDMLPEAEKKDLNAMIKLLVGWQGQMDSESVGASIYAYTTYYFTKSLFQMSGIDQESLFRFTERAGKPHFEEALFRIIDKAAHGDTRFNPICRSPLTEYPSENICAYNIAQAFIQARRFLLQNVSENPQDWKWGKLSTIDFQNLPWSKTPLKVFFHRQFAIAGNDKTLKVAEYLYSANIDSVIFKAYKSTSYNHIIELDPQVSPTTNLYGIASGLHENPPQGNYFDQTEKLYNGDLNQMTRDQALDNPYVLRLEPLMSTGRGTDEL